MVHPLPFEQMDVFTTNLSGVAANATSLVFVSHVGVPYSLAPSLGLDRWPSSSVFMVLVQISVPPQCLDTYLWLILRTPSMFTHELVNHLIVWWLSKLLDSI